MKWLFAAAAAVCLFACGAPEASEEAMLKDPPAATEALSSTDALVGGWCSTGASGQFSPPDPKWNTRVDANGTGILTGSGNTFMPAGSLVYMNLVSTGRDVLTNRYTYSGLRQEYVGSGWVSVTILFDSNDSYTETSSFGSNSWTRNGTTVSGAYCNSPS